MWAVTGWALATWLKLTALLAGAVGIVWLVYGTGSGWFWTACAAALLAQIWIVRGLSGEWAYEARASWWWAK